jgi:hypothetical protein
MSRHEDYEGALSHLGHGNECTLAQQERWAKTVYKLRAGACEKVKSELQAAEAQAWQG